MRIEKNLGLLQNQRASSHKKIPPIGLIDDHSD